MLSGIEAASKSPSLNACKRRAQPSVPIRAARKTLLSFVGAKGFVALRAKFGTNGRFKFDAV